MRVVDGYRYQDQEGVELYDLYDKEADEPTPELLRRAKVIKENEKTKTRVVQIDYPIADGIFSLGGKHGRNFVYEEAGKKAWVRGDGYIYNAEYKHPYKDWESRIRMMPPYEYIKRCAKGFSNQGKREITVEELIETRMDSYDLNSVFKSKHGKIFYPCLDYAGGYGSFAQEGLHRAVYAMMNDIIEIPVIIIM